MAGHDEEFEKYLGEFEPRRPRALPEPGGHQQVWARRLAAAAVVTIALGASLWVVWGRRSSDRGEVAVVKTNVVPPQKSLPEEFPIVAITRMALNEPERLDERLIEVSRSMLPDFRGSDSTLRVLAKQ